MKTITYSIFFTIISFFFFSIPTAVITNPFFTRMTPVYWYDYIYLIADSILLGIYLGLTFGKTQIKQCKVKGKAFSGGILGFLGIACPICNKILLLLFGVSFLMIYFEPIRPYLGLLSMLILLWAVKEKLLIVNLSASFKRITAKLNN